MAIQILYTTSDAIRAAIGIDEDDLSDAIVAGQFLDLLMMEGLQDVMPDYETQADASDTVLNRLKLWCTYFGALSLVSDAQLGIPMKIQANTDAMQRFQIDFEKLKENLAAKVAWVEAKLNPDFSNAVSRPQLIGAAAPDYDPIVGA